MQSMTRRDQLQERGRWQSVQGRPASRPCHSPAADDVGLGLLGLEISCPLFDSYRRGRVERGEVDDTIRSQCRVGKCARSYLQILPYTVQRGTASIQASSVSLTHTHSSHAVLLTVQATTTVQQLNTNEERKMRELDSVPRIVSQSPICECF
ncbi:hypothetical protein VTO42DRAFT_3742 [Malbranchea cinnamomea]